MPIETTGQNLAVDGLAGGITHVGLLDATLTELTGGSPAAYARKAVSWAASASGQKASSADLTFDVPAATIVALGYYSASTAGTRRGWVPLGGYEVEAGTVSSSTDAITDYAHGLSNGDRVFIHAVHTNSVPSGLATATLYYVVGKTTDTFQVSTTSGGSPVNVTASGKVLYQRCAPFTAPGQSTVPFPAGTITLDARLMS